MDRVLLAFFLLFLPTQLGRHFWPPSAYLFGLKIDYLSPTLYWQDILLVLIFLFWLEKTKIKILSRNLFIYLIFFSIFALLNIFVSPTPWVAFWKWLRLVEFLLLGIYISFYSSYTYFLLGQILPFAIFFEFFLSLFQVLTQSSAGGLFWFLGERTFNIFTPGIARGSWQGKVFLRPYGTFSHPNSLAGFTLVALIVILGQSKLNWWAKGATIVGFILLLLSFSRTVWLASFLIGMGLFFNSLKNILRKKKVFAPFLYWTVLFSLPFLTFLFTKTTIDDSSFIIRQKLALFALELIKRNWLLGVGLGNFVVKLAQGQSWEWLYWLQPVHNIYLLIGSELGFLGLSVFVGLIYLAIKRGFASYAFFQKEKMMREKYQVASLLVALGAILFTGLFDHYWLTLIQNQLLLVIILGLIYGLNQSKKLVYSS